MLTSGISFINFKTKTRSYKLKKKLINIIKDKNQIIQSLSKNYKNNYNKKQLTKFKTSSDFRIIGMGGSILGAQTIYSFLRNKIKKNFLFIDNLQAHRQLKKKKGSTNLIISKSGNTIETIVNANILVKKR